MISQLVLACAVLFSCQLARGAGGSGKDNKVVRTIVLERELESGSFSVVYSGSLSGINHPIAFKCIHKSNQSTTQRAEDRLEKLLREIKILERISSVISPDRSFIVGYYGAYYDHHRFFVAIGLALCDLTYLHRPLSRGVIRSISLDLFRGLAFLNSLNIIHQDLKAENILVNGEGHAVITDFNLSYMDDTGAMQSSDICGSISYMAYEMTREDLYRTHGPEVDVWSAGCVLFLLSTGELPFPTQKLTGIKDVKGLAAIIESTTVDYKKVKSVDSSLAEFIKTALTLDPTRRPKPHACLLLSWLAKANSERLAEARDRLVRKIKSKHHVYNSPQPPEKADADVSKKFDELMAAEDVKIEFVMVTKKQ